MKTFGEFLAEQTAATQASAFFRDFLTIKDELNDTDITLELLERLKSYTLGRVAPNSAKVYLTYFKKAFWRAERSGYNFPVKYDEVQKILSVRQEASEHIYLNAVELKMLESYTPSTDTERFTKSVFLLCAYTGCRVTDYPLLTEANFYGNELRFTAEKSKVSARMPLHPLVPQLIDELREFNYPDPIIAPLVGQYIKIICRKVGIDEPVTLYQRGGRRTLPKWQFVATHTARRSFATNLYLDGYSIKQISGMMGHKNTNMTEKYIISSFADNITGSKTYLIPDKTADENKMEAVKRQMMQMLGLSEADASTIVEGIKDKLAS